ncbi:MAG: hypothetical protein GXZ08_09575 [Tissierellia bacterium]|nr:hypothetical protein [Tissierellia bacterium]
MEKRSLWKESSMFSVMTIALVLFSSHAGGGFATGNQANTYFVNLGWTGIVSAVISMALLTLMLKEAIVMYNSRGLKSYKELFETLYHPFDKLEILFEVFYYIMVVMVIATTISGASSALEEYFSINYSLTVLIVGVVTLVFTIFGAGLLRAVGGLMGIGILVTALLIYVMGSFMGDGMFQVVKLDFSLNGFSKIPQAVMNGFVYAGFQCVQLPAMVSCSGILKSEKEVSTSMKISFVINALALGLSVAMLLTWKGFYSAVEGGTTLPTLTVTQAMGFKWMTAVYAVLLVLCLISSGVSVTFGFVSRFENMKLLSNVKSLKLKRLVIASFILMASMLLSMVGLTNIIKYGYGYCGYLAIGIIILPFLTVGAYKNRMYLKEESFKVLTPAVEEL